MRAKIYQPARNAMQSGTANPNVWILEFAHSAARAVDPLMGWTSSDDMDSQVRLRFDTQEAAQAYAAARNLEVDVEERKGRKFTIRPRGYGENFATDRKGAWTH